MKRCLYLMAVVALLLAVGCSPEKAKNEQSPDVVADTTDTVVKMPTDTVVEAQPEVLTAILNIRNFHAIALMHGKKAIRCRFATLKMPQAMWCNR